MSCLYHCLSQNRLCWRYCDPAVYWSTVMTGDQMTLYRYIISPGSLRGCGGGGGGGGSGTQVTGRCQGRQPVTDPILSLKLPAALPRVRPLPVRPVVRPRPSSPLTFPWDERSRDMGVTRSQWQYNSAAWPPDMGDNRRNTPQPTAGTMDPLNRQPLRYG